MTVTDLTWALSSCVLILAVIALRAAFGKRMRPGLRYALWGLVLLRLLVPVQLFDAPWGIAAELPERAAERSIYVLPLERANAITVKTTTGETELRDPYGADSFGYSRPSADGMNYVKYADKWSVADILHGIWLGGVGVTAVVMLVSNLCFYTRLCKRRKPMETDCPLRVFSVENLSSSCLFGNAIYVAAETAADETRLRHILAHELSHHRHGDHVWTLLRCAALSLHWYNPLVWWAAALSRQDSELCADAGALKYLGEDERESYGATLIELSARRAPRASLLCTGTTMTNGERSLKERVTMIARRPSMTAAVVVAVMAIAAVAAGCAFAGAAAEGSDTVQWNGDHASVNSVTLWSAGREFTAEEPESIGQILDAISNVVFTRGGDANEPGAQSLAATIRYRDGTEERVTFPRWERDGATYDAGVDSIERFAQFFADWPEPQTELLPGIENTESDGERLRLLLSRLSLDDIRLSFYEGNKLRSGADGASALMATDYLAAFTEIVWEAADPMDEADRANGWRIELDASGWRLICFQSSRRVLVEASGGELWLIARDVPDAQYSWISYATLENWYLDALTAEQCRADGTPLTAEELKSWRDALATMRGDELNLAACFFSSYYADPRDLDLAEFLAYCPLSEPVEEAAEFDTLHLDWEIEDENGARRPVTLDRMPVPIHRYRVSRINDALEQYTGMTLDDLTTDWRRDERMIYSPEYDSFYNFTSDFGPGVFEPRYGERDGDTVMLWSDDAALRLWTTDGGWQILSHLPR